MFIIYFSFIKNIVPQNTLDYTKNLQKIKPDFVVHGDDWKLGSQNLVRKKVIRILKKWGGKLQLSYLMKAYELFPGKDSFFLKNLFFDKLAGNALLREQIKKGMSEEKIRASWQPALKRFKAIRKKYLLYKDCISE